MDNPLIRKEISHGQKPARPTAFHEDPKLFMGLINSWFVGVLVGGNDS